MALQLGPGGRAFLVALGVAVIAWGLVRAGLVPVPAQREAAPSPGAAGEAYVLPPPAGACDVPLRVAVPPRAAALRLEPGLRPVPVAHGAAALSALRRREVDGAVASVAELAAAEALPEPLWIADVLGAGADLVLAGARAGDPGSAERVAAPPGSAEAFFARGTTRARLEAVDGPRQALQRLGAGHVAAAALPRWMLGPAGPVGRPAELAVRAPLDPVVLVLGAGLRCVAQGPSGPPPGEVLARAFGPVPEGLADLPASPADLVRAWAGQRRARPQLPPLELLAAPALAERIWGGATRGDDAILPARASVPAPVPAEVR